MDIDFQFSLARSVNKISLANLVKAFFQFSLARSVRFYRSTVNLLKVELSILSCEISPKGISTLTVKFLPDFQFSLARSVDVDQNFATINIFNFQFSLARSDGNYLVEVTWLLV